MPLRRFKLNILAIIGLSLLLIGSSLADDIPAQGDTKNDIPEATKLIIDQKELNDEKLGEIIKDFGEHVGDVMSGEMGKLLEDLEKQQQKRDALKKKTNKLPKPSIVDEDSLNKLKNAKDVVTRDIKARIELAGKRNEGDLPQAGLNMKAASNFLSQASEKLQSAGSFIGSKMSSLSGIVKGVPSRLRKMMHWPNFLNFKIKFNKTYKTLREELYRQMIYLNTQARVSVQQMKFLLHRSKHLLKATQYADTTEIEFHEKLNNGLAENKVEARDPAKQMPPEVKAQLEKLAREGKNIMGMDMSEAMKPKNSKTRKRRAVVSMDIDDDNVEENFDMDIDMTDAEDTLEDEKADENMVDVYTAAFESEMDESELMDLENVIDNALNEADAKNDFVPIDLRETGCIITPENQEDCGCCYAHAATAIASYFNCMDAKRSGAKVSKPDRYAPRFTASCGRYVTPEGTRPLMNGCRGGKISAAIEYLGTIGTMPFLDYEFAQISAGVFGKMPDECAYPRPKDMDEYKSYGTVKVPQMVGANFESIPLEVVDLHLRTVGPVALNAWTWKDWASYGAGIYDGTDWDKKPTMHSTVIIGHDRDQNGRDYWIILNSHGTAWGERGFARVYTESLVTYASFFGGVLPIEHQNKQ